jgi:hypothetical protein
MIMAGHRPVLAVPGTRDLIAAHSGRNHRI